MYKRFEEYCTKSLDETLLNHPDMFSEDAKQHILGPPTIHRKLNRLFVTARRQKISLYVLIDGYDNFANTVLVHHGEPAYQTFTHGDGFYRSVFAAIKAGVTRRGIERLFVTGVSPVTMDDVTSGFNIGTDISLEPEFDEMLGFTETEVRDLLETYRNHSAFDRDIEAILDLMREWYDGYRFARQAGTSVYNTDMVLYFLRKSVPNKPFPDELIGRNVRIDYGKLRHLLVVNRQANLNGNFDMLRDIIADGGAKTPITDSFPLERLADRENFLSLLYYFGRLSIYGSDRGIPDLAIPNQTPPSA